MLNSVARVVDVACGTQVRLLYSGSRSDSALGSAKEEHKLARLADEILTGIELYQNNVARLHPRPCTSAVISSS